MNTEPFVIERTYPVPAAKVWEAITDKDKMKKWYFDLAEFKAEPGFAFEFIGTGNDGQKYRHLCKVTEVVQGKKLAYSWTYDGYLGYSVVTFELFDEGDGTRLKLTHAGLESFPVHPDFASTSFAAGWKHIIGKSLAEYLAQLDH